MKSILLFLLTLPAFPQFPRLVRFVATNPSGACGASYIAQNTVTGVLTGCVGGTWTTIGGGTGTPGGSDTQIQYNNAGAFGGLAASIFAKNTAAWTAGAFAYDFTASTVSLPAPWVKTTVANTYTAGTLQSFVPSATIPGLSITGGAIPSGILGGGMYMTTAGRHGWFDGTNVQHSAAFPGSGTTAPTAITSGKCLESDGAFGIVVAASNAACGSASGANAALSNLASVSINTTLLAQTGVDLGSTAKPFRDLFLFGGGTFGTNYFRFTGTPTSARTITVPDVTATVVAAATSTTTTQALFATSTAGAPAYRAVAAGDLPVANTRSSCQMVVGADNGAVLADADIGPQSNQCFIPYAATVVEVDVQADAGTPNVIPRLRHCSTYASNKCSAWTTADFTSSALAATTGGFPNCSKTSAVAGLDGGTTCAATLQNTAIAIGDWVELKSGTAGGTAKRLTVSVIYTIN